MDKLKQICDKTVCDPKFAPAYQGAELFATYCNLAVISIAGQLGLTLFRKDMLANDIFRLLAVKAKKATAYEAADHAISGGLAIAAQEGKPHGHVAVIYPAPLEYSPSWGKYVPAVANVGRTNGIMRASQAFKLEPDYFIVEGAK